MSSEQHASAFLAYVAGLLGDLDRYLAAAPDDLRRDGAGYRVAGMWLTDAELADYLRDLAELATPQYLDPDVVADIRDWLTGPAAGR